MTIQHGSANSLVDLINERCLLISSGFLLPVWVGSGVGEVWNGGMGRNGEEEHQVFICVRYITWRKRRVGVEYKIRAHCL